MGMCYIVAYIRILPSGYFSGNSSFSVRIETRQYGECLIGFYENLFEMTISFDLNIFGKKYFTVLFYEWDTFDI